MNHRSERHGRRRRCRRRRCRRRRCCRRRCRRVLFLSVPGLNTILTTILTGSKSLPRGNCFDVCME